MLTRQCRQRALQTRLGDEQDGLPPDPASSCHAAVEIPPDCHEDHGCRRGHCSDLGRGRRTWYHPAGVCIADHPCGITLRLHNNSSTRLSQNGYDREHWCDDGDGIRRRVVTGNTTYIEPPSRSRHTERAVPKCGIFDILFEGTSTQILTNFRRARNQNTTSARNVRTPFKRETQANHKRLWLKMTMIRAPADFPQ